MKVVRSPRLLHYVFSLILLPMLLFGQGTYYNSIDTGSVTFISDLHTLIYSHTQISYDLFDETNVANFASRDTTGGQKVVTCVYSGENYVYTPPFAWTTFSREHTFCHSWMPTYSSTSGPEYSDQHHLFPTNQDKVNNIRSNHPLGIVTTVTSSYLACKLGKNTLNQTVFEPRSSHKGDAARALLYMSLCYNGVNGKNWTFSYLNGTTLPALSEAPQDLDLLLQWSQEDPPDAWEQARNEYVYSIQHNRNPFVDHPEWVNLIDFNTMTKKTSSSTLAVEPTNYPSGFTIGTITDTTVQLLWTDAAAGTQAPAGYLLAGNTTGVFTAPLDGVVYTSDSLLADGTAQVNIPWPSSGTYTFRKLNPATTYDFRIYSYNGTGTARNYKTSATIPAINGTTTGTATQPTGPSVIVNEYFNGIAAPEWIELLVLQDHLDMRGMLIREYSNAGAFANALTFTADPLWSSVRSGTMIVVYTVGTGQPVDDFDPSDKKLIIAAKNATYFSGSEFQIGGTNEAIEIFTASPTSTHIYALGHGTLLASLASIPSPRINKWGSIPSGSYLKFVNVHSAADFLDSTHVEVDTVDANGTPGFANDASEAIFIDSALPVELTSFSAASNALRTELSWRTATETGNFGFDVERSELGNELWKKIGFIPGAGTSASPHDYGFVDNLVFPGFYRYRLKQIDRDGKLNYSTAITVAAMLSPESPTLTQNYPNPFNPVTMIRFSLPKSQQASVRVYTILGEKVATLFDAPVAGGASYAVPFDATGYASGMYMYVLQTEEGPIVRKMLLTK